MINIENKIRRFTSFKEILIRGSVFSIGTIKINVTIGMVLIAIEIMTMTDTLTIVILNNMKNHPRSNRFMFARSYYAY